MLVPISSAVILSFDTNRKTNKQIKYSDRLKENINRLDVNKNLCISDIRHETRTGSICLENSCGEFLLTGDLRNFIIHQA